MTTLKIYTTATFIDERDQKRGRVIEYPTDFANNEAVMLQLNGVSKSKVHSYTNSLKMQNALFAAPDAGSEIKDTLRLYFEMVDLSTAHFDIPDAKDDLFLATSGAGAMIAKDRADWTSASGLLLEALVAHVEAGNILISDGETVSRYLNGARV